MLCLSLSSSLISKSANKENKSINPNVCGDQILGKMPVSTLKKKKLLKFLKTTEGIR